MKKILLYLTTITFIFALPSKEVDVIKQTNGNELRGKIVEENLSDGSIKIELLGGSGTVVLKTSEIEYISKATIEDDSKKEKEEKPFQMGWGGFCLVLLLGAMLA